LPAIFVIIKALKNTTMLSSSYLKQVLPILLFSGSFLLASCKKDKDHSPAVSYPKTVSIQYKVTSVAGFTQLLQLQHTNETGGVASMNNVPLPFTKTITKTVDQYDVIVLMFGAVGAGELKGDIIIDGNVASTKSFTGSSGTSTVPGQVTYTFQ
jgi:hypothetical protein